MKYQDEGKICYYCHKKIGPGCDWYQGRCPMKIKPKLSFQEFKTNPEVRREFYITLFFAVIVLFVLWVVV